MPGGRLQSFRLGDRSELLVEHLLAGIAFTTRVPRQEDIGLDFLCSLITGYESQTLLKAGPFFAVQAKSSTERIVYSKPHELEWIRQQENPILICVADREAAAVDVYSSWNLLCGVLGGGLGGAIVPTRIALCPGILGENWPFIKNEADGSQEILLGKPIVRITHDDIFDKERTERIAEIISSWIALDRTNIVNRYAGIFFVLGPLTYETGAPLDLQRGIAFYWNPQNLEQCAANLGLSATGLWRVLHHDGISLKTDVMKAPWAAGLQPMRQILEWCCQLNPSLRGFLPEIFGPSAVTPSKKN